jgi:alginate biosynthesis protein Alg44
MKAPVNARITHESETQRQYPRFSMPARALLNGKEYEVKNLSAGGIALRNVGDLYARGKQATLELKLPFSAFSLSTPLTVEAQHYNAAEKSLGCRFINLTPEQVSFLNHAIKSFIAGEIVTAGNILNIAARNNFTKSRTHANTNAAASFRRQLPGLLLVLAAGVLIAMLLAGNLYNSMFIVRADDAAVMGPAVAVRAAAEGTYNSRLDPGLTLVQKGQAIGSIVPSAGGGAIALQSPCDCYISKTYAASGDVVPQNQQIMTLIPIDAKPWIIASIDPARGKKIAPDSQATISIFGSRVNYTGHAVSMESALSEGRADAGKPVLMKIALDQKIPVDFVNRMAAVTFAIH